MCNGLISLLVIAASMTGKAKDRAEPPHTCISANGPSLCVSGLRWIMYGNLLQSSTHLGCVRKQYRRTHQSGAANISLFDADDRVVESATATMEATVPPGGRSVFNAPFEEPVGTGVLRLTLYTNQVRVDVVSTSRATTDLQIPILFTTGDTLGVRRYKKRHGLH